MGLASFLDKLTGGWSWRGGSARAAIGGYARRRVKAYTTRAGKKVRGHYRSGVKAVIGVAPQGSAKATARAAASHNLTKAVQAVFGEPPKPVKTKRKSTRKVK